MSDQYGKSGDYALYLRKSRADLEAELRGEGETLSRHRRALTQLAAQRGLNVVKIYEEIGSADTIAGRPQMQALLADVEAGKYAGVIVNDADRLARGDGIDQGIVKQAFYSTGTLIVTPIKTFDPTEESDEDFFDFSLFMARFEYRKIKQRMQTGRARSAAEGNYLGSRNVFGYKRVKRPDQKGWTLEPDPEKAEVVRMIFQWYAYGDNGKIMGAETISNRLNAMGIKTDRGCLFEGSLVRHMLGNVAYIGTSTWNKKIKNTRKNIDMHAPKRVNNPKPIYVENAHPAIIDQKTWNDVQSILKNHKRMPKNEQARVSNVLAGLIKCSHCGRALQRKPGVGGRPDMLHCKTYGCPTTGIYIPTLERTLLDALESWRIQYSSPVVDMTKPSAAPTVDVLHNQLAALNTQMSRIYDFLEQGIYTPAVFVQRRDELELKIDAVKQEIDRTLNEPTTEEIILAQLPQIEHVLELYPLLNDLEAKNMLLKSVICKVVYTKTKKCTRADNPADYMTLDIFPALPSK